MGHDTRTKETTRDREHMTTAGPGIATTAHMRLAVRNGQRQRGLSPGARGSVTKHPEGPKGPEGPEGPLPISALRLAHHAAPTSSGAYPTSS